VPGAPTITAAQASALCLMAEGWTLWAMLEPRPISAWCLRKNSGEIRIVVGTTVTALERRGLIARRWPDPALQSPYTLTPEGAALYRRDYQCRARA
jgi:hypothetical protein